MPKRRIELGAKAPITPKVDSGPLFQLEPEVERASRMVEKELIANYGEYPSSHPVFQYVDGILRSCVPANEYPKLRLVVTHGWNEPNAGALPTGTILFSDRLLEYCEDIEELQFILRHEWKHIQQEHGAKKERVQKGRLTVREEYKKMTRRFGQQRLQEYEADVRARTDDSELELNPYGGIRFTERLIRDERKRGAKGDIAHGRSMDRLLNLHFINRILDSKSLQYQLTPISEESRTVLQKTRSFEEVILGTREEKTSKTGVYIERSLRIMRTASTDQAILMVDKLSQAYKKIKKAYDAFPNENLEFELGHLTDLLKLAIPKVKDHMNRTLSTLPRQERAVFRGLVAAFAYDVNIEDALEEDSPAHAFVDFFEYFEELEDFERLPQHIRALKNVDVIFQYPPLPLLRRLCSEANGSGMFDDTLSTGDVNQYIRYIESLVDAVISIYPEGAITREPLLMELLPEALTGVPKKKMAAALFAMADRTLFPVEILRIVAEKEYDIHIAESDIATRPIEKSRREDTGTAWGRITVLAEEASYALSGSVLSSKKGGDRDDRFQTANLKSYGGERRLVSQKIRTEFMSMPWSSPEEAIRGVQEYISTIQEPYIRRTIVRLITEHPSIVLNHQTLPAVCRREDVLRYGIALMDALPGADAYEKGGGVTQLLGIHDKYISLNAQGISGDDELEDARHAEQWRDGVWMPTPSDMSLDEVRAFIERLRLSEKELFKVDVAHENVHNAWTDLLYAEYYYGVMRYALHNASRAEFFVALKEGIAQIPQGGVQVPATELIIEAFETYSFDLSTPEELEQLLTLTAHIRDIELANRLQEQVIEKMFDVYESDALEHILFRDDRTRRRLLLDVRARYIEERIRTPQELRRAVDEIARSRLLEDEDLQKDVGQLVALENLSEHFKKDVLSIIEKALDTEHDDTELVKVMALGFVEAFKANENIDVIDGEPVAKQVPNVDQTLRRLYEMDDMTRRVVIRDLLVGANGVLFQPREVRRLIQLMFEKHIARSQDPQEAALRVGLHKTMEAAARVTDPATLYFMLEPFLFDHMWRRPQHATDWDGVEKYLRVELEDDVKWDDPKVVKALMDTLSGRTINSKSKDIHSLERDLLNHVEKYAPAQERRIQQQKTGPIEFIRMVASQLGAPGVRLLQVVGQYVPMSVEMQKSFSSVYDGLSGQSKLSGFVTLDREWKNIDTELIDMGKTIGGASMNTVWETTTANGEEVAKVLNPNAEFFVDSMCSILEKTFEAMKDTYPTQARLGVLAVRDIREWVKADINETQWMARDREFAATHQGFTVGGEYSIRVPKVYGEESKYYKREEKIPGKNLTKLDELITEGHDARQIVRLVCMDVIYQVATGRVHSDTHPGNIRVTPAKEVAWLDRAFYIDLVPQEQLFLTQLLSQDGDPVELFAQYCANLSENGGRSLASLRAILADSGADISDPQGVARMISAAKENGVYIPLKVTILVKDFLALNKLAADVGLSSLREAIV